MRYLINIFILLAIVLTSCQSNKTIIEGNYIVKKIDFFSVYNMPDSTLTSWEKTVSEVDFDTLNSGDKYYLSLIKRAVEEDVLRKPFIRLENENDEELMLYMPIEEYDAFKNYSYPEVRKRRLKVHVVAKTEDISYMDIKAYKLIRIKDIEVTKTENNYKYKRESTATNKPQ